MSCSLAIISVHRKLTKSSLLHTVLCEYLRHCLKEDRDEILLHVQNSLLNFTSTRDGVHVAMMCIWHASNKVCYRTNDLTVVFSFYRKESTWYITYYIQKFLCHGRLSTCSLPVSLFL